MSIRFYYEIICAQRIDSFISHFIYRGFGKIKNKIIFEKYLKSDPPGDGNLIINFISPYVYITGSDMLYN